MTTDTIVLNTTQYAADVMGFGGPVPLQVHISQGRVDSVTALPNNEDTQYFRQASSLLHAWDGLPLDEAARLQVDAVSGATFSSRAIINGVRQTLAGYQAEQEAPASASGFVLWGGGFLLACLLLAACRIYWMRKKR